LCEKERGRKEDREGQTRLDKRTQAHPHKHMHTRRLLPLSQTSQGRCRAHPPAFGAPLFLSPCLPPAPQPQFLSSSSPLLPLAFPDQRRALPRATAASRGGPETKSMAFMPASRTTAPCPTFQKLKGLGCSSRCFIDNNCNKSASRCPTYPYTLNPRKGGCGSRCFIAFLPTPESSP
jgi:hypothetical protein